MRDVVIVDSVRTGLAKSFRGGFNQTRPDDMVAHCIDSLLERNQAIDAESVDDCVVGCAGQLGEQAGNIARLSVALSRLPLSVPGLSISRACSSGLNSIAIAATQIASGCADTIIAGGVESITARERGNPGELSKNPILLEKKPDIYIAMGNTAEVVARRYQITREYQDEYALQSQQRIAHAQQAGLFDDEIVPMGAKWLKVDKKAGTQEEIDYTVSQDECNRPDTTAEGLAELPPAFEEGGSVTAGNASQLSDGASMTLVMSKERAESLGLKPLAYFRGFTVAGCEPDEMGIGPVFAVPKLLDAAGMKVEDIDLFELNEAFASQCLYCRDRLEVDPEKYNVNGGSIAIGHPFGMTGSRLVGHLTRELQRRAQQWGVVTMCIGGGMGAAGLFEAIP